jgi:hypothetical protein
VTGSVIGAGTGGVEQRDGHPHTGDGRPTWSTPAQAAGLVLRGATARTAGPIAVVVGTVLSLVNEGPALASGHAGLGVWVRICVNLAIPFLVASFGYLAPLRGRDPEPAGTPTGPDGGVRVGLHEVPAEQPEPPPGPAT